MADVTSSPLDDGESESRALVGNAKDDGLLGLTRRDFSFTGSAGEYFGICIRTFLLAIVTLGIYDAWGTVERRRYLLGHTKVAGHGFDYHAKPLTILKGRIIAVVLIVAFNVASQFSPMLTLALFAGFILIVPWVIVRSLRFQARNTSYRNIRFNFDGTYLSAFGNYLLLPLVTPLSLGLLAPEVTKLQGQFVINNMSFGRSSFVADIPFGALFKPWLGVWFISAAMLAGIMISEIGFFFALGDASEGSAGLEDPEAVLQSVTVVMMMYGALIVIGMLMIVYAAVVRNVTVKATKLEGGHAFTSWLSPFGYLGVSLGTIIVSSMSFGLMIPWATVTLRRYMLEHTALLANGDLDGFIAHETQAGGAIGAEFGDMQDIGDGVLDGIVS